MDVYADQVIALLDDLGVDDAVLGGASLGANVSLLAAVAHPERVRALVLEMPVLEWAVPAAALTFVPLLLGVHYAAPLVRVVARITRRRTGVDLLDTVLAPLRLPPDVAASILHGILVGPVAPTIDERRRLAAPTLVVAHDRDLIHPFSDAENLAEQVPDGVLVRARGPLELRVRPARLTACIADFVAAHSAR
jgi:pimeloyl-ACP methyl ester carboxylesterase